ncbi:MAG: archease [Candidatus Nitrosopelagicus sp.]|jgi:SHS2 domain-containing protein|nr:archease [Candidatus Nitrosopelagicus sp.]MBT6646307.1 archease [Nitrososphaerota archaeon]MBT3761162.1 archease [Candidatus Nitrosopelagicus sp.]MBT4325440.1 archease [Candidatus Nitrosopelagicus sp.]MBT4455195.1 archease [Candidatus Nitrosopelagicus sp.]|tara:strand:- start:466 stop:882 length:417 start_codon:yes stop_codon:yes gene_type:complete
MSYKTLEHATDAIIEVTADNLKEAFEIAGISVIETILDISKVDENNSKKLIVKGKDLKYLLYNWLEEMIILTITDGFAGKRILLEITKNGNYQIDAEIFGEAIDLRKHDFKVEIKSPTFHEMEIKQDDKVIMKYLLDL